MVKIEDWPKDRVYEAILILDSGFGVTFWQISQYTQTILETDLRLFLNQLCREFAIEEFKNRVFRCI
jgi:hypothetical protein